ncbi:MAG: glycosyltransferase family 4 protein [Chitinivibrionales bacterium]|nr:glycosyltransferase family 4 protein [Chitinivibrionales bacterium]
MNIHIYSYDHLKNPWCGGGGAYRVSMVHSLLAQRHTITFFSGRFKNARNCSEKGMRFSFLGLGLTYALSRLSFALLANVHALFGKADIVLIEYSIYAPVFSFLIHRSTTAIMLHHVIGRQVFKKYGKMGIFPFIAEQIVLRFGRHIITDADSTVNAIQTLVPRAKATALYCGFDSTMLSSNSLDKHYILYFGRMDIHMKGLDMLLPAFETVARKFPQYRLIIAGRGGSEHDLQWIGKRIAQSPVAERIERIIGVSLQKKQELFRNATFVCIPSRFEGWCIVALEAAASCKATIGSDIAGLQDTIQNGKTGILFPAEDCTKLSQTMERLLSDEPLRKKLGAQGYVWAQKFTWERIAQGQERFYEQMISENQQRRKEKKQLRIPPIPFLTSWRRS